MELHLSPEVEAGLARMAQHEGVSTEALLESIASSVVQDHHRISEGIQRGIDHADNGEFVAGAEIERRFARTIQS